MQLAMYGNAKKPASLAKRRVQEWNANVDLQSDAIQQQTSAGVDLPDIIDDNCSRSTTVIMSSDASSTTKQTHTHLHGVP